MDDKKTVFQNLKDVDLTAAHQTNVGQELQTVEATELTVDQKIEDHEKRLTTLESHVSSVLK